MNLGTNSKSDTSCKTAGAGRNNDPIVFWLFDFFLGEPENFVGVPVQKSGWGVSYRRRNDSRRAESPKYYSRMVTAPESWKSEAHGTTCRQPNRSSFPVHSWTSSRQVWFVSASSRSFCLPESICWQSLLPTCAWGLMLLENHFSSVWMISWI